MRPDGTRGPGLFAYLRGLQGANGGDRRDVIATVFRGIVNRMVNGYLLRDVINKVNGIHFTSSDEIHTLGALYESMLKEMRDAAGDSGEFYTPAAGGPLHGRGASTRGWARPCSTRPAAPAASWSRRTSTWKRSARRSRTARRLQTAQHLRRRGQAAALPAGADEPAAARAGIPADRPRQQPALPAHARSATATGWT